MDLSNLLAFICIYMCYVSGKYLHTNFDYLFFGQLNLSNLLVLCENGSLIEKI